MQSPAASPLSSVWDSGWLDVGDSHRLYYEQWGRQDGPVALVLHGGPGSGFTERLRSFFDPAQFRVIAFDQRGSGRSTPRGECQHNTTHHLLADIERLRHALGVQRWLVVGGSWGATLALAYATCFRTPVAGLLLRGFFWPGAAAIEEFFAGKPWRQWATQLGTATLPERHAAARAWWQWELSRSGPDTETTLDLPELSEPQLDALYDRYRVQAHYLQHACWLDEANLGRGAADWSSLPIQFFHGAADRVCALAPAERVHGWLAGSDWHAVEGAGHDPFHPAMVQAMREALTVFAQTSRFSPDPATSAQQR